MGYRRTRAFGYDELLMLFRITPLCRCLCADRACKACSLHWLWRCGRHWWLLGQCVGRIIRFRAGPLGVRQIIISESSNMWHHQLDACALRPSTETARLQIG